MVTSNIIIDGEAFQVRPDENHEYVLETALVAKGYGVSATVIRRHKQSNPTELIEGKHWVVQKMNTLGGSQSSTLWTKRGIIRLGFFIHSERAKKFRDAAEDLVIKATEPVRIANDADLSEVFEAAAHAIRNGQAVSKVLALIAPRCRYGEVSATTGKPRTRLMPSYYTSRFEADERTQRFIEMARAHQFEMNQMLREIEG